MSQKGLKFDKQGGYRDQYLFCEIFSLIIEIFYFIIVLAQRYQFFVKSPTGATTLDFMDPRFITYMTSAFQRYAIVFCGIFFQAVPLIYDRNNRHLNMK